MRTQNNVKENEDNFEKFSIELWKYTKLCKSLSINPFFFFEAISSFPIHLKIDLSSLMGNQAYFTRIFGLKGLLT